MKNCKKIALLAILFILSMALNVYAADYTGDVAAAVTVTQSATTAKIGETVTVIIVARCEEGIEGFDGVLTWNATKLELTNAAEVIESTGGLSDFSGETTGEFLLTKMASSSTKDELNVATLNFKVLDEVEVNEKIEVVLSEIEVGDSNENYITLEDQTIEITVIDDETIEDDDTPGDEEQVPGDEEQEPDDEEQVPDDEEQTPNDEEQTPSDEEQKPSDNEEEKDPTIADKPINNAGLATFAPIAVIGIVIAIVFYEKYRKYRDVK